MVEFFTRLLGVAPEHVDGVDVWWKVGPRTNSGARVEFGTRPFDVRVKGFRTPSTLER